jgi:hypothetical protein
MRLQRSVLRIALMVVGMVVVMRRLVVLGMVVKMVVVIAMVAAGRLLRSRGSFPPVPRMPVLPTRPPLTKPCCTG